MRSRADEEPRRNFGSHDSMPRPLKTIKSATPSFRASPGVKAYSCGSARDGSRFVTSAKSPVTFAVQQKSGKKLVTMRTCVSAQESAAAKKKTAMHASD